MGLVEELKPVVLNLGTHIPSLSPMHSFSIFSILCYENNKLIEYIFKSTYALSDTVPNKGVFSLTITGLKNKPLMSFKHPSVSKRHCVFLSYYDGVHFTM